MTLLCPCGETFEVFVLHDEIQLLCPVCAAAHRRGDGDDAPSWRPKRDPGRLVRLRVAEFRTAS